MQEYTEKKFVAELNSPGYQFALTEAMNGMTPNERCTIKSLIEFGKSVKQHQQAMEQAGLADRARLVLEQRQQTASKSNLKSYRLIQAQTS